jgi:NAD(P)H-dependent flavin oxidoreductase YrpB (nitropropane dioxygenase family)
MPGNPCGPPSVYLVPARLTSVACVRREGSGRGTNPLRRAAAAAGDADRINIWAGTGYRQAGDESAVKVLNRLAELA